ncbi:MAG TPA: ATP-binding protein [Herbaspirillum sp.]|jgi:signal transduction histidine kinase
MRTASRAIGAFLANYRPLHSLRRQFAFVLLLLALLVLAFGGTAIFALNQSRSATQELAQQQLVRLQASHDLVWQILSSAALADKLVKTGSAEEAGARFTDLEAELKKVGLLVDKLSGDDDGLNVLDLQYSNQLFAATASAVVQQRGMLETAHRRFDLAYRRSYDAFSNTRDSVNANASDNARMILELLQTANNPSTVRQLRTTLGTLPGLTLPWSDRDDDPFALRLLELERQATIDLLRNALRQHVLNLMASAREQSDHFANDYRDGILHLARTTRHRQLWVVLLLSVSLLLLWLIASQFIGRHVLGRMRVVSRYLRLDRHSLDADPLAGGKPVPVTGTDEIADMARALEHLLADRGQLQLARKQLEDSQARLSAIIEYAADGFVIVQEGVIRQLNPAARNLLGWQPGEAPRLDLDCLAGDCLAGHSGPAFQADTVAHTQDGRDMPVEVSVSEVEMPSGRAVILVIRDATLRRETERQLTYAKDAAESARSAHASFLSDMAEQFHVPLNAILNHTQILESEPLLSDLSRRRVSTIDQNAQQLRKLINNILDLAELEAERLELEVCKFDLRALLHTVADRAVGKSESKGLAVRRDWASDLPAIHGDESRLRQILLKLMANAVTFTHAGYVKLHVEWLTANKESGVLRFEVEDSGVGIAPDALRRLVERFNGNADAGSGNGDQDGAGHGAGGSEAALGLMLNARLLALMGSRLQARSTVGQGSVFWFDLAVVYT